MVGGIWDVSYIPPQTLFFGEKNKRENLLDIIIGEKYI